MAQAAKRRRAGCAFGAIAWACAVLASIGVAGGTGAQCAAPIMDDSTVSRHFTVNPWAATVWDADGAGPGIGELVVSNGAIGISRGGAWRYTAPYVSSADKLTTWDPDGDGPQPALLLRYNLSISKWDGVTWSGIPTTGLPQTICSLVSWDKDGPGGNPPSLVASAYVSGGANGIFERVGSSWVRLGSMNSAATLVAHDPDGSGPKAPELYAGGWFSVPGPSGPVTQGVMRWSGTDWEAPGAGLNNSVLALVSWDRDGDGPIVPYLVAGGSFTASGANASIKHLAKWNGSVWTLVSSGANAPVTALSTVIEPDTGLEALIVGGYFTNISGVNASRIASFNGAGWRTFGAGLAHPPQFCVAWKPRGPLSDTFEVCTNVGRFDGEQWRTTSSVHEVYDVSELGVWDPDGAGPDRARLVIASWGWGGSETLVTWDGLEWTDLPTGTSGSGTIRQMLSFDPDGDGPDAPMLVLAGSIRGEDPTGKPFNSICMWDGSQSWAMGEGFANAYGSWTNVTTLGTWDRDGSGPEGRTLFAGGEFTRSGGTTLNRIGWWDGEAWRPLGSGLTEEPSKMLPWDPDGSGPEETQLLVGGGFSVIGDEGVARLALWDGVGWRAFPGDTSSVDGLATIWDPDGTGPLTRSPVTFEPSTYDSWCDDEYGGCGSTWRVRVMQWSGTAWDRIFSTSSSTWCDEWGCCGDNNGIGAVQAWDPDGRGPRPTLIAFGGLFGWDLSVYLKGNNYAKYPFDTFVHSWYEDDHCQELDSMIRELASHDPDGLDGPVNPILAAGGYFNEIISPEGSVPGVGLVRFMDGAPGFLVQPRVVESGYEEGVVGLEARALGPGTVTYQWYKDDAALVTGATGTGAIVHEARAPVLVMSGVTDADDGEYWCVATNACGDTESERYTFSASGGGDPCGADHNADTVVDILDLLDFVSDFSACEGLPAPCGSAGDADRNGDTTVDILDFLDFIGAFSGGCD
jgi:hypothetical protein